MKFFSKLLLLSLICAFAFTPAAYAAGGCSAAGFKTATTINLEATPFGIAVADFDADGHLDLVVAPNNNTAEIIVLLGRGGTQRFGPPTNFPAGGLPRRMAAGDFNGDGKPDLAVSLDTFGQPSGELSILLNDGTGKFGAPSIINLADDPLVPVLSDFNNDGKLDIVVGLSTGDGHVAILLGNGAGGFSHAANSPLATDSNNAGAIAIGDFNEDGKRDLALPGNFGELSILLGDGTGGFAAGVNTTTNGGISWLIAGDFNEDTHLDILMSDRMLLGTGTGSFGTPTVVGTPADSIAAFAIDANLDNHLDVVTAGNSGLTIFLGAGAGTLVQGKSYTSGFTVFGAGSAFALPGDFNEDGKIDLAAVQRRGVGILDGDGTGAFNDALSYSVSVANPSYLVAADFNNDGKQDFATLSPNTAFPNGAKLEVALGDGSGGFTRRSVSNFSIFPPTAIATADFNSDGKLDMAVTQASAGRVLILLNDGTGGFQVDGFNAPNISVGFQPSAIEAGDFNNDTKADLVVIASVSNSLVVLLGNGSGGFTSVFGGSLLGVSSLTDIAIGDFNADGKSDLAVTRSDINLVNVLHGDGAGHFSSVATPSITGFPASVAVRDLNGDSKPDIAVSSVAFEGSTRQPYITVLINNGASGFNPGTSYPTDEAGALGIGDFNSDNHPDLAASTNGNGEGIVVITNKGNGDFNAPVYFSAGSNSDHLAISDFNNDGKDDALISNPSGNSVGLLLNNFAFPQPCFSINDVTVTENDSGTVDAVFTVTLSSPTEQFISVNYFTRALGSINTPPAIKGVDFESVSGTLFFPPTTTTQTITVPVKGDLIDEFDQFFQVVLTTPVQAAISDGKGLGTITDNDAPATISVNDTTVVEGTSTQNSASFTISLNGQSEKPITVELTREAGTASPNSDFQNFGPDTLQFPAGTTSKTYLIPIINDNTFEPDETFFVNLGNPTNATIADGQGQGTITNDDPQPTISIASSFRTEGALGTSGNATFEVKLSNLSYQTITVAFATADGTATAGSDYVATSGTVTFNPGETTKSVAVEVLGDNIDEVSETYFVNLSNPTNATIGTAQGTGTIQDDDGPTLSINDASVTEGNSGIKNLVFTVTLSAPSVQGVFVNFGTAAGTATPGVDFSSVFSSTVFIPAGSTSATFNIRVFGDLDIEPDEQFTVNLQFPSNATIADGQGIGTIVNDDSNGKLQFSSQTFSATEDAGGVVVTVNRVDGATGAVTVDFATSNGTATAGSDYPETTGTLTLNPGETSKSFFITFVKDNIIEPEETLTVTLSNPTGGATLGTPTSATLTIKTSQLFLALEEAALDPNQVVALDSLLGLRDPFAVVNPVNLLFGQGTDRNTRVVVFVTNLQLAPGDAASVVRVNLVGSNGQTYDLGAEDVRQSPVPNFMQITFRLPDNLATGVCSVKIKAHDQESNQGNIRIQN